MVRSCGPQKGGFDDASNVSSVQFHKQRGRAAILCKDSTDQMCERQQE